MYIYIRDMMGIIHSVYDVKILIEFVKTNLAQCRAPYKGDIGSTPTIGFTILLIYFVLFVYFMYTKLCFGTIEIIPFTLKNHANSQQTHKQTKLIQTIYKLQRLYHYPYLIPEI